MNEKPLTRVPRTEPRSSKDVARDCAIRARTMRDFPPRQPTADDVRWVLLYTMADAAAPLAAGSDLDRAEAMLQALLDPKMRWAVQGALDLLVDQPHAVAGDARNR